MVNVVYKTVSLLDMIASKSIIKYLKWVTALQGIYIMLDIIC